MCATCQVSSAHAATHWADNQTLYRFRERPIAVSGDIWSRTSGASVTFEPGAWTVWHRHPLGQTLIVTAGSGWIQQSGVQAQLMHESDVV
jgi:quercetin dioxygenase-like cupin family protein